MSRVALLTRPLPVFDGVADFLHAAHIQTLSLPTLQVLPHVDSAFENHLLQHSYNGVIFVSQHAVHFTAQRLNELQYAFRPDTWLATVGEASSQAIAARWPDARILKPIEDDAQDSDGLWRAFHHAGVLAPNQRILLVRAQMGRNNLLERLQSAHITVDVWACYTRQAVRWHADELQRALHAMQYNGLVIAATSIEGLAQLVAQFDDKDVAMLFQQPLVGLHPAIAQAAQQMGFAQITCVAPHKIATAILAHAE